MRHALFGILLLAAGLAAHAEDAGNVTRVYEVRHVEPQTAVLLIQSSYPGALDPGVELRPERTGHASFVRVTAPASDQEAIARVLREKDIGPPLVMLQVVLLDALDATLPAPELQNGASAALKDVRTLFPFKGYRVRHTAAFPASRQAAADLGGEFTLRMDARPGTSGTVEVPEFEIAKGNQKGGATRLIATSFSIRSGETVVLGTSLVPATEKVDPQLSRALVVLVTALP